MESNRKKNIIRNLQVNGRISSDEKEIIKEIRLFYSQLYAKIEGKTMDLDLEFSPVICQI